MNSIIPENQGKSPKIPTSLSTIFKVTSPLIKGNPGQKGPTKSGLIASWSRLRLGSHGLISYTLVAPNAVSPSNAQLQTGTCSSLARVLT